ncbi:MAG: hypothetical protein WB788_07085 [Thermoplasmata archaeon]
MAEPVPTVPSQQTNGTEVGRAIGFAVYLTGGLVTLAFGVLEVTSSLGQVLNCLYQTDFCQGGFSGGILINTLPGLGGGAFLVVVAAVLFILAHRNR